MAVFRFRESLLRIFIVVIFALPGVFLKFSGINNGPVITTLVFGLDIVVAAILLSWAAEAAQIDISSSFAVAILALIAILPEYAVDLYFSFRAGTNPEYAHYAAANMTGSNRLLIGIGWPLVLFAYVLSKRYKDKRVTEIILEPRMRIELSFLFIAAIYSFIIPFFRRISILDTIVLIPLFLFYIFKASNQEQVEPVLRGAPAGFLRLPKVLRFFTVNGVFLIAAFLVFISAQPFADSLINLGKIFKINEFILVQWLAPIATESPELIVAVIYASRRKPNQALGTLLSSKINQWTLLIGSIPIAYLIGGGKMSLILDARQNEEFLLTASQTLLAFSFICNLRFSLTNSIILLILFLSQFFFTETHIRLILSAIYIVIAVAMLFKQRSVIRSIFNFKKIQ